MNTKFSAWICESEDSQNFIDKFTSLLNNRKISFTLKSTYRQLQNGTLEITINDVNVIKDSLRNKKVDEHDVEFSVSSVFTRYYQPNISYTIYKKGAIKEKDSANYLMKFNTNLFMTDEKAANLVIDKFLNSYAYQNIKKILPKLSADKYTKQKPVSNVDISKLMNCMDKNVYDDLILIKQKYPAFYSNLINDFIFLCVLTIIYGGKISVNSTYIPSNYSRMDRNYTNDFLKISFNIYTHWSISGNVKLMVIALYESNKVTKERITAKKLIEERNYPNSLIELYSKISSNKLNLDDILHKYRGSISSRKFGV